MARPKTEQRKNDFFAVAAVNGFLHSWRSSKMSQFFPFGTEECSMEEKLVCKKARKNRETDQHLNFFEKNPRLKVSTMAEFKEYPCPNKGLLFWESIIHFPNF